jgi:hypothetical protein
LKKRPDELQRKGGNDVNGIFQNGAIRAMLEKAAAGRNDAQVKAHQLQIEVCALRKQVRIFRLLSVALTLACFLLLVD